jgi:uncharacterized small protein (DUF1192 family)
MKTKDLNQLRSESFSKGKRREQEELELLLVSEITKRVSQLRRNVFSDKEVKIKK